MKRSLVLLGSFFLGLSALQAAESPLTPFASVEGGELKGQFQILPAQRGLTLDTDSGEPLLRFEPQGSETVVLLYGPSREMQDVELDSVSVDFLINHSGSVGLYLRGDDSLASRGAYLVLVNIKSNRSGQIRLFKHSIWPLGHPDEDLIAGQDLRNIHFRKWYRLTFTVREAEGSTVVLGAKLVNTEDGSTVAEMEMGDPDAPLRLRGQTALRLYSYKKAGGHLEIKNLQLNPR